MNLKKEYTGESSTESVQVASGNVDFSRIVFARGVYNRVDVLPNPASPLKDKLASLPIFSYIVILTPTLPRIPQ